MCVTVKVYYCWEEGCKKLYICAKNAMLAFMSTVSRKGFIKDVKIFTLYSHKISLGNTGNMPYIQCVPKKLCIRKWMVLEKNYINKSSSLDIKLFTNKLSTTFSLTTLKYEYCIMAKIYQVSKFFFA